MKPVMIEGCLSRGFVAKRNIDAGEEPFYDYGVRDEEIPWLISDGKAMVEAKPKPAAKNRVKLRCPIRNFPSLQYQSDGFVYKAKPTSKAVPSN